jgi:hypothetical protein
MAVQFEVRVLVARGLSNAESPRLVVSEANV